MVAVEGGGEAEVLAHKPKYIFVHHKFHVDLTRFEPGIQAGLVAVSAKWPQMVTMAALAAPSRLYFNGKVSLVKITCCTIANISNV
jgi:hypothetical protein